MATQRTNVELRASGGDAVKRELTDVGDVGDRAFRRLADSAKGVPSHLRLVDSTVKEVRGEITNLAASLGPVGRIITSLGPAGLAAAAGIGALGIVGKLAVDAAKAADALSDQAAAIDLNVQKLQEIRFVASQFGVAEQEMDGALRSFIVRLGEAQAGTGRMAERLKDMDPAFLKQIQGARSSSEAFDLLIKRLAAAKDATERAALAKAAFGETGVKLAGIVGQEANAFATYGAEARRLGIVIDESLIRRGDAASDALDKLSAVIKGNATTAFLAWSPTIKAAADEMSELIAKVGDLAQSLLPLDDQSTPRLERRLKELRELREQGAKPLFSVDLPLGLGTVGLKRVVDDAKLNREILDIQKILQARKDETAANKDLAASERELADAKTAREASEKALLKLQEEAAKSYGTRLEQIQTQLGLDIVSLSGLPGEKQLPGVLAAMQKAQNAIDKAVQEQFQKVDAERERRTKESQANAERAEQAALDGEIARLKRRNELRNAELDEDVRLGLIPREVANRERLALVNELDKALTESIQKGDRERQEQILKASKRLQEILRTESHQTALAFADPLNRKLLEIDHRFEGLIQQILELKAVAGPAGRELADQLLTTLPEQQAKLKQKAIDDDARERTEKLLKEQEEAVRDFTDRIQAPILSAATNIQNRLANAIEAPFTGQDSRNAFRGFVDDMVSTFRRAFAEIAALAIAKPIIVPVIQVAGDVFGQPGIAQKVATQFGGLPGSGLLSGLSSISSGFSLTDSLNKLGFSLGFAKPLGPVAGGITPGSSALFGNITLSQALGSAAAAAGGAFTGNQIAAFLRSGRTGGTVGGAVGGAAGSFLGPVGAVLGSVAGGLFGTGVQSGLTNRSDLVKGLTAAALVTGIGIPFAPFIGPIAGLFQSRPSEKVAVTTSPFGSPGPYPTGPFGVVAAAPGTQNFPNERFIPSISQPLVAIDQIIANRLSDAQKATVTSALQGSVQGILNVGGGTTLFALVQQRIDTILSSLLGPDVTETLLAGIQRTDDHIEEFVQKVVGALEFMQAFPDAITALSEGSLDFVGELRRAATEDIAQATAAIQAFKQQTADLHLPLEQANEASRKYVEILIGLRDAKAPLSETEQALKAVEARFEAIGPLLQEVGLTAADAEEGLRRSKLALTEGFDEAIRQQILGITDPLSLALKDLETTQAQRVKDAQLLGANLVAVERLNALERENVLKQQGRSIRDYLLQLTASPQSFLPGEEVLANAEAEFARLRGSVLGGNRSDIDNLVAASRNLLEVSREQFASSEQFFQRQTFVEATLRTILGEQTSLTGSSLSQIVPTLTDIGAEISTVGATTNSLLKQLLTENQAMRTRMDQLQAQLARLLAA